MNICKLCQVNDASKTNTHYLTDAIIRSALNENGENIREKGYYFDMSSDIAGIDFNFQRKTSAEKIESELGRQITSDEIDKAMVSNPFAVDFMFCPTCEKIFTEIEDSFIHNTLKFFKSDEFDGPQMFIKNEVKQIRLFFLLQIIRTNLCVENFNLSQPIIDQLRNIILNHKTLNLSDLNVYPLAIAYLRNEGERKEVTGNFVGYNTTVSPNIIYFNEFVIQFFESADDIQSLKIPFIEGVKSEFDYINLDENDQFVFKIINHEQREVFNLELGKPKMETIIEEIKMNFIKYHTLIFGISPSEEIVLGCIDHIIKSQLSLIEKYSVYNIKMQIAIYIHSLISKK